MTFKELIIHVKGLIDYLYSRKVLVLVIAFWGGVLGFIYPLLVKPKYKAELRFVLSGSSGANGLAGLAGQFGIDLGNTANDDAFQGDNIIELLKSQKIIKRALFRRTADDKEDLIVNDFLKESHLLESWQENEDLKAAIPFSGDRELKPVQDSLLNEICDIIINRYLQIDKVDKNLNFYSVTTLSKSGALSVAFTNRLVAEATKFYIETKTKTARDNLGMLQNEADSLRVLLNKAVGDAAVGVDRTFNLNPALQINRVGIQKNQFQAQVLGAAYGEVIKNLEIAKITLQKETPLVQIIDEPTNPLKRIKKSKVLCAIVGFSISFFLISVYLLARNAFVSLMKGNE